MPALLPIVPPERRLSRMLSALVAFAITAGYLFFLASYFAPAPTRPGIDENAYLLAGANLARHHTPAFKPDNDYRFVGAMWVRPEPTTRPTPKYVPAFLAPHVDESAYYPKYPAGLPLLNGVCIKLLGDTPRARELTFFLPEFCTALAVLGMFFLARPFVGAYLALCAQIVLATAYTTLLLSQVPGSHAPALAFVTWGFVAVFSWLHTGKVWRGVVGGFLLGFAVTIRYSEALLLCPFYPLDQILADTDLVHSFNSAAHPHLATFFRLLRYLPVGALGVATLFAMTRARKTRRAVPAPGPAGPSAPSSDIRHSVIRSLTRHSGFVIRHSLPVAAWAVPVGALVLFNYRTLASPTGYDATHESAAFTTAEFLRKWDFTISQLYVYGLIFFLPLTFAGLLLMFRTSWRHATLVALWIMPSALLYTSYYWGNGAPSVAYLRFFLTIFPALLLPAFHLLHVAAHAPLPNFRPEISNLKVPTPASAASGRQWAFGIRHSLLGPLPAALLTAAAAAVGLTSSLPELARQHRGNLNLAYSASEFLRYTRPAAATQPARRHDAVAGHVALAAMIHFPASFPAAPASSAGARPAPVVFADDGLFPQLLMHLQYVIDDGDWYTTTAFEPQIGGGFGILGFAQQQKRKGGDTNTPVVLQDARIEHTARFLAGKTDDDLKRDFHEIVDAALGAGRPVYAILTVPQYATFNPRYVTNHYTLKKLASWSEPCNTALPEGRLNHSPLAPPNWNGEPIIRWYPQALTLYQIEPVTKKPGTHPAAPNTPVAHVP